MLAMSSQKMADWTSQSQTISERQHSDILFWVSIKALGMIGNRYKTINSAIIFDILGSI